MSRPLKLTSREAVGHALELLAEAWRAGHVVSFSLYVEVNGISRVNVVYQPDAPTIDLETLASW